MHRWRVQSHNAAAKVGLTVPISSSQGPVAIDGCVDRYPHSSSHYTQRLPAYEEFTFLGLNGSRTRGRA